MPRLQNCRRQNKSRGEAPTAKRRHREAVVIPWTPCGGFPCTDNIQVIPDGVQEIAFHLVRMVISLKKRPV